MKTAEEVYGMIGDWGPFQRRLFALLALPLILDGFQTMVAVFLLYQPPHRCQIPGLHNDTFSVQGDHHRMLINDTIPRDPFTDSGLAECTMFSGWNQTPRQNGTGNDGNDTTSHEVQQCSSWVYDKTEIETTGVEQFDLVCERKSLKSHVQMSFLLGVLVVGPFAGFFCDWFGRKRVLCVDLVMNLVAGVSCAFPYNPLMLSASRFMLGVTGMTMYMAAYVLGVEMVSPGLRARASSIIIVSWLAGPLLLSAFSFFIRRWEVLQLISSIPVAPCLALMCWMLPESPRWLLLKGRKEDAWKVIQNIAKVNNLDLSQARLDKERLLQIEFKDEERPTTLQSIRLMCSFPRFIFRALIICFNWMVISMTYFGLSLNVGSLGGSLRVNYLASCSVELAGYLAAWLLVDKMGRTRFHCCFMMLAGLAQLATTLTVSLAGSELQWTTTALAMVGKFGVSACFTSVYLITAEVYPTLIRNFGLGCSSTVGRLGSVVSPYIADLVLYVHGPFSRAVPLVIFGSLSVMAALSTCLLPETLHRPLPDTMEDAVSFDRPENEKTPTVQTDEEDRC